MSEDLAVLIKQYALDLRRNASGGDDYPYEYAKATADYLEELIKRAKGNCTCAQAGFPDSCDNCDGFSQTPDRIEEAFGHLAGALMQAIPSDDQIIIGHMRDARDLLQAELRERHELADSGVRALK